MRDHSDPRAEGTLVARAKRGDADAFGDLVTRYQELAQRTAFTILRDADEAQDAAQEAFVKAFRSLGGFREGAPLRPWLLRIVANEAINRARSSSRHRHADLAVVDVAADDDASTPEHVALASERRRALLAALNAMSEDDRVIIAYRYFFDLGEAEMADALGIPRGTVKSRLSRAMARLREGVR